MRLILQLFGGRGLGSKNNMRNYYLSNMSNRKARNIIDQLYRPGAKKGDGGTADALKDEAKNKNETNKSHYQKAKERIKNIERVLDKETLTNKEREILEKIYKDLKEAIELWEQNN